ncbi:unnamed protein product [Brassica oleracea var. botrytis]
MLRREKEEVEEGGGCRWSLLIASSSSRMEAARRCKCRTCCERSMVSGAMEEGAELLSLRLRVGTGGAVTFPALKQHPISVSTFLKCFPHTLSLLSCYVLSLMGRSVQVGPCLLWAPYIPSYSDESNPCLIDTIETKRNSSFLRRCKRKIKIPCWWTISRLIVTPHY